MFLPFFIKPNIVLFSLLLLSFTDIIRLKVAILVRGSVGLLVVSVEVGAVILRLLPAVIVSEWLPVAVLHNLPLGQVRATLDKLGKPEIRNNDDFRRL